MEILALTDIQVDNIILLSCVGFGLLIVCILIAVTIEKGNKTEHAKYKPYAVCPCGFKTFCHFGNLFHLIYNGTHIQVCPKCGENKRTFQVVTGRYINDEFETI